MKATMTVKVRIWLGIGMILFASSLGALLDIRSLSTVVDQARVIIVGGVNAVGFSQFNGLAKDFSAKVDGYMWSGDKVLATSINDTIVQLHQTSEMIIAQEDHQEVKAKLQAIDVDLRKYTALFKDVENLVKTRDTLSAQAREMGETIVTGLTEINQIAWNNGDSEIFGAVGQVNLAFLLAEKNLLQFNATGNQEQYGVAEKKLNYAIKQSKSLDKRIGSSQASAPADIERMRKLLAEISPLLQKVKENMTSFVAMRADSHKLFDETMHPGLIRLATTIGEMAKTEIETMKSFVGSDQGDVSSEGEQAIRNAIVITAITLMIGLVLAWGLGRSILTPLLQLTKGIGEIEQTGKLSLRLPVLRNDEFGQLATSMNSMVATLQEMIEAIQLNAQAVGTSSSSLTSIASGMRGGAEEALQNVLQVVGAAKQLVVEMDAIMNSTNDSSSNLEEVLQDAKRADANLQKIYDSTTDAKNNVSTIASAVTQASANLHSVSSAVGHISSEAASVLSAIQKVTNAFQEIRQKANRAEEQSSSATSHVQDTVAIITKLDASAQQIGQVVNMIKNIADQTNMLALNAAIESAGAGEAGKGFAVVANEVKELARQTNDATRMIEDKISEIQDQTQVASASANHVAKTIHLISQSNGEILAAVAVQGGNIQLVANAMSATASETTDVSRQMSETDLAIGEINRSLEELSRSVQAVVDNVAEADEGVDKLGRRTDQVTLSGRDIARRVTESTTSTQGINKNIDHIRVATQEFNTMSVSVHQQAQTMSDAAGRLQEQLGRFSV